MTLSTLMIQPSVWMQKSFFQSVEKHRQAYIGKEPQKDDLSTRLQIRVGAIAHAVFQFAFAAVAILPVFSFSVITVMVFPGSTGIWHRDGSVLERIWLAVAASFSSLLVPCIASIRTAIDLKSLEDIRSFSISKPIYFHSLLLSATLPPLDENDFFCAQLREGREGELARQVGEVRHRNTATIETIARQIEFGGYRWRQIFPNAVLDIIPDNITQYPEVFDTSSSLFDAALGTALMKAYVFDDEEDFAAFREFYVDG
jgi:hypothetical protein